MLGKSLAAYVFIRASILALHLVPILSLLLIVATCVRGDIVPRWVLYWAIAESAFFFFVYIPRKARLQKPANHPPIVDRAERKALFLKCHLHIYDPRSYATGWFLNGSMSDVGREDVVDWILWGVFSTDRDGLIREHHEDELDEYVAMMENVIGFKLPSGRGTNVKSMRLTFDPVYTVHRPLVWYTIVGFVDIFTSLSLSTRGFRHYAPSQWLTSFPPRPLTLFSKPSVSPSFSYWYRPHRSTTKLPILFIHGIGIGLFPYIPFLAELIKQDPEVGILALEILPISMRITGPLPTREETCAAIASILTSLHLPRVVLVSHSYGTVIATHMLHSPNLSTRIASLLFIDPIPFLLHLPATAYNFVYRAPREANEWLLWYYASRDPDIARALSRHFFWTDNILWKEELRGRDVAVVLSGEDQIVPSSDVWRYLTGEDNISPRWSRDDLEVLFYPSLDHAEVFDAQERRRPLLEIVRRFTIPTSH